MDEKERYQIRKLIKLRLRKIKQFEKLFMKKKFDLARETRDEIEQIERGVEKDYKVRLVDSVAGPRHGTVFEPLPV